MNPCLTPSDDGHAWARFLKRDAKNCIDQYDDLEKALLFTEVALALDPTDVQAVTNKGTIKAKEAARQLGEGNHWAALGPEGLIVEAVGLFDRAMRMNHGYEVAQRHFRATLRWTGEAWTILQGYDQAVEMYRHLVAIDPTDNESKGELYALLFTKQNIKQSELRAKRE